MQSDTQERSPYTFTIGLLAGACVGVGLAIWLTPRAATELGGRITDAGTRLGQRAADEYQHAGVRVSDAVDELTRKAQGVRADIAQTVARGAREVERYATAAGSASNGTKVL